MYRPQGLQLLSLKLEFACCSYGSFTGFRRRKCTKTCTRRSILNKINDHHVHIFPRLEMDCFKLFIGRLKVSRTL